MKIQEFTIAGMTCIHCVMAVKKELTKIEGVAVHSVEIGKALVSYDENSVGESTISKAIDEAGYTVVNISGVEG